MEHARGGSREWSKGDISRLEQIYRRYVNCVYTFCLYMLANIKTAEEATIDTFVWFSRKLARWLTDKRIRERLRYLTFNASLMRLAACNKEAEEANSDNGSDWQTIASTLSAENNRVLEADAYELLV